MPAAQARTEMRPALPLNFNTQHGLYTFAKLAPRLATQLFDILRKAQKRIMIEQGDRKFREMQGNGPVSVCSSDLAHQSALFKR
jgi:hypothetical protein